MLNSSNRVLTFDDFQERKEIVQDVVDRLLSNPEYKENLLQLNEKYPSLKDYNRNLCKSNNYESN